MEALMRVAVFLSVVFASSVVWAQQPPAGAADAMKSMASSADVASVVAQLKAERGDRPQLARPLLKLAPYTVNIEYRAAVGPAAVHDKEAELFYVLDGAGTLTTGGRLVNPTRPNPDNQSGTGVEGGTSRRVSKGDVIMVPEGEPHWFSMIDGTLTLMSLHLPRASQK
jgi:mannose-6-phosphate isomerase-like protein (cupin superfamily)